MQTYIISDGLAIKIGKSRDAIKRLKGLQTSSARPLQLLYVFNDDREKSLHTLYSEHRLQGEWFSASVLSFYTWLMLQVDRDDWIGDFAQDARDDRHFPCEEDNYWVIQGKVAVNSHGHLCWEAKVGFARAYHEWRVMRRRAGIPVPKWESRLAHARRRFPL